VALKSFLIKADGEAHGRRRRPLSVALATWPRRAGGGDR
jgi:hypothetical protein